MNTNWSTIALVGCLVLPLAACSQISAPSLADDILTSPAVTLSMVDVQPESTPTLPTQGQELQIDSTRVNQLPSSSGLESLVEKATDDLAQCLSISTSQIDLVEAKDVVWPDASLGCPRPGLIYAQVLTPSFLIQLKAHEQVYEYHTDMQQTVILCSLTLEEDNPSRDTDKSVDDIWPNETKDNDVIINTPTK